MYMHTALEPLHAVTLAWFWWTYQRLKTLLFKINIKCCNKRGNVSGWTGNQT